MSTGIWCLLGLLLFLLSFKVSDAIDNTCDFYQKVELGKSYYIYNPTYPENYHGALSCRWHAQSDTRVRITCNTFNIPASPNCVTDAVDIYKDPTSGPLRFCGDIDFSEESTGEEMIITLTSTGNSTGGRFLCVLEGIREEESEECNCGWKKPTKIVGGKETGVNEYPMMVALVNVPTEEVYCGGTIISSKHVVTAASCLYNNLTVSELAILVGDHDLTTGSETNATKMYRVANFEIHPLYDSNTEDYDIAVIAIDGKITYTNEVGPACLPFQHYLDSFGGLFVDVLGWGLTEFAGSQSNTLQKAKLSVINFFTCKKLYFPNLTYRQICTFTEGKGACQLDSGGPVLWQNPTTRRIVVVGIISFGSNCASDVPTVNTRVGSFIDWITTVTSGESYCRRE